METPDLYGAIEGGGTKFLCAVGSGFDSLLARPRARFDSTLARPSARFDQILDQIRIDTTDPSTTLSGVLHFFAPYRERLRVLGVACFGPLELQRSRGDRYGSLLRTPKPGWSGFPLRATLESVLFLPVAIDTDVNGAALAEQRWGALRDADPAVYVTVGTGVGVGVVIAGQPVHGLMHPELGHMRVHDPEFAGICPFHGSCVEGLVSAPALRARTGRPLEELTDDHPVWTRAADVLGQLLHAIVLAYSPERIVLGGGVLRRAGLLGQVQRALVSSLSGYVPREVFSEVGITGYLVPPGLGDRAGLLGGFALATDLTGASRLR